MEKAALIQRAIDVLPNSYVPYSHFHVAAALLCKDGTVYTGNNIENASYTPTICAERTAFFQAVKEGKREFDTIVVCGGKDHFGKDTKRLSGIYFGTAAASRLWTGKFRLIKETCL